MGKAEKTNLYLVTPVAGYTPQIGRLVSMMNYARRTTLDEVEGLGVEHLDYLHDAHSNSIGALLLHIAAVEAWYQAATFGPGAAAGETGPWGVALDLGERARREIRGHGADYYLRILEGVRVRTLEEFARRDDAWLDEETPFWGGAARQQLLQVVPRVRGRDQPPGADPLAAEARGGGVTAPGGRLRSYPSIRPPRAAIASYSALNN